MYVVVSVTGVIRLSTTGSHVTGAVYQQRGTLLITMQPFITFYADSTVRLINKEAGPNLPMAWTTRDACNIHHKVQNMPYYVQS